MEALRHVCTKVFSVNIKKNSYGKVKYLLKNKREQAIKEGFINNIPITHFIVNKDNTNY